MRTREEALLAPAPGDQWERAGKMRILRQCRSDGRIVYSACNKMAGWREYKCSPESFQRYTKKATYLGGAQ